MTTSCNIWMICLKLNWFFNGLSRTLQFSQFVWTLSYSVWDVFNNFLLIDRQIEQIEVRLVAIKSAFLSHWALTPFHFLRTLPFTVGKFVSQSCTSIKWLVNGFGLIFRKPRIPFLKCSLHMIKNLKILNSLKYWTYC